MGLPSCASAAFHGYNDDRQGRIDGLSIPKPIGADLPSDYRLDYSCLRPSLAALALGASGMLPYYDEGEGMSDNSRLSRLGRAFADWWSFQMGTPEGWFDRTPETPEDRAIRLEGERISRADACASSEPLGLFSVQFLGMGVAAAFSAALSIDTHGYDPDGRY
jgi:hypothetical protein